VEGQQLSWLVIGQGWKVVSSDGREVGYIEDVVGDRDEDIFNGLSISLDLFDEPRYVPSEKVGRIFDDSVEILFTAAEVERLDEFLEPPPSLDIGAERASWSNRVIAEVTDIDTRPDDVPFWKRVVPWLKSLRRR
jgi:hypothetical protein